MDLLSASRSAARLAGVTLACACLHTHAAGAEVSIVGVAPARTDTLLVCGLETAGLPGERSRETLASGLPSMIVVAFSVLDAKGHERSATRAEIRIEPDLWENLIVVRTPIADHRLPTIDAVADLLSNLAPMPVAPLRLVDAGAELTIHARIAVHALAPAEQRRVRALFGGGSGESDRREVSIGLGSLVRFFLGRTPEEDWIAEASSARFRRSELANVAGAQPPEPAP